jgi:hypothetical protein
MGHNHAGWTIISASYLLAPERWLFAFGAGLFTAIHYSVGPISTLLRCVSNNIQARYMQKIEMSMLAAFLLIACVPAHLLLGLHAILCSIIISSSLLWMWMIIELEAKNHPVVTCFRAVLFIGACLSTCAMIALFPFSILVDIGQVSESPESVIALIVSDRRWQGFAPFEWAYYFIVILFLCTNLITVTNNVTVTKER